MRAMPSRSFIKRLLFLSSLSDNERDRANSDSKISESNGAYSFTTTTIFEINRGSIKDTYELVSTGNLMMVDRNFPNNPHGLLITNYFENTLKKISDES